MKYVIVRLRARTSERRISVVHNGKTLTTRKVRCSAARALELAQNMLDERRAPSHP